MMRSLIIPILLANTTLNAQWVQLITTNTVNSIQRDGSSLYVGTSGDGVLFSEDYGKQVYSPEVKRGSFCHRHSLSCER
jgi:hypothetical protein